MKALNLILLGLLISSMIFGQKMEFFGQATSEKITPVINFSTGKKFNDKIGISFFSLVSANGWAEAYFGPTFSPTKNSQLSFSAGIETGGNNFRMGMSAFVAFQPRITFLLVAEKGDGRDNYWYHSQLMKNWSKVSSGLMIRRFAGMGPRVEFKIYEGFSLWAAPLYDIEDQKIKGIVSLVVDFK